MRKTYLLLFIAIVICLSGCTSGMVTNKKIVKDNVFYSTLHPKAKIIVNNEYEYLGLYTENKTFHDFNSNATFDRYIFAKYDSNRRIISAVEILIKNIRNGSGYWISDVFGKTKYKIFDNVVDVYNKPYKQLILIDSPGNTTFYDKKGFICPTKAIARGISRNLDTSNKKQLQVYYWEDIGLFNERFYGYKDYSNNEWLNYDIYNDKRKKG